MSIPHEIHQIWLQGADHLPEKHRAGGDAWRRMHPGWRYTLWDDTSIRILLTDHYPWFLPTYRAYRHLHQRADSGRYFILYHHGGVYADTDTSPIKPIDGLFDEFPRAELILPLQPFSEFERSAVGLLLGTRYIVTNGFFAGVPGFNAWPAVHRRLMKTRRYFAFLKEANVTFSAGPAFLSAALKDRLGRDSSIAAIPHYYFEPDVTSDRENADKHYVLHAQDATWHSPLLKAALESYYRVNRLFGTHR